MGEAWEIATDEQEEKGWTDSTLIQVLCNYIDSQGKTGKFRKFMQKQV